MAVILVLLSVFVHLQAGLNRSNPVGMRSLDLPMPYACRIRRYGCRYVTEREGHCVPKSSNERIFLGQVVP